jgi:hypothetical protein
MRASFHDIDEVFAVWDVDCLSFFVIEGGFALRRFEVKTLVMDHCDALLITCFTMKLLHECDALAVECLLNLLSIGLCSNEPSWYVVSLAKWKHVVLHLKCKGNIHCWCKRNMKNGPFSLWAQYLFVKPHIVDSYIVILLVKIVICFKS